MNRREFITLSGAASLAAVATPSIAAQGSSKRDYYELRQVFVENDEQRNSVDAFLEKAFIPAANRLGLRPVGVFYPKERTSVYVLVRHPNIESVATWMPRLIEDSEFLAAGEDFINAPASAPAFRRMENTLMVAFEGMPQIETPVSNPDRVFQLRIYESPSVKTNLKKIEMFNEAGEIKIFREVGLNPVFFGMTLAGTKMPNLTYMLGFKNMEEQQGAWKRFGGHPDWKRISKLPEYADKEILSGITNIPLVAAKYSQV